jgi:hypothetical protein
LDAKYFGASLEFCCDCVGAGVLVSEHGEIMDKDNVVQIGGMQRRNDERDREIEERLTANEKRLEKLEAMMKKLLSEAFK